MVPAHSHFRRIAALSMLALCLAVAGCSLVPPKAKQIPPPPSTPVGSNKGELGDAIRLTGQQVEMRVRVLRVLDPLPVAPADQTLDRQARFVGVELELENVGTAAYNETPLAGATLITTGGAEASPESVLGGPCAQSFPSNVKVAPGQRRRVCPTFEVAPGKQPATFSFRLDSGFGEEVGEWRLQRP
ncbi:MAG: hypothetical protein ABR536_05405 [Solirubrobacterales bacterium]